jgi:hypothetical protein
MASVAQNAGRSIGGTLHVTNDTISSGAAAEYTMRQLYEHFRSFTREQFNAFVGDAKLHKAAKSASPLDVAVLTVQAELRTYVSDMTEATSTLLKVDGDKNCYVFTDFLPDACELKGRIWDDIAGKILEQSVDDWLCKNGSFNYLHTKLVLVGASGVGKSEFATVLARELSRKHGFGKFCSVKLLDTVGRLTLAGLTDDLGAFVFSDFELRTKLDRSPLTVEQLKGLLGPTETGGYDCRYHAAVLPKYRPRIWTINSGLDGEGARDFENWFDSQMNASALAALSRGDTAWLRKASAHDRAVARRACVVHITDPLFDTLPALGEGSGASTYFNSALALPPRC